MRIGFIGLGRMGSPMAANIAKAGHSLVVYDIRPEAAAASGARSAASPAEVAEQSDVVMLSLPGFAEVSDAMLSPKGVLAGAKPGLVVADATTIAITESRELARLSAEKGVAYLDSPVSGAPFGVAEAGAGTLTVMVGGDHAAFERALPMLQCIGKNIRHVGASGSGTAIKLINQAIYVSYMAAFSEGLALGQGMGIDLNALLDVLGTAAAGRPTITTKYDEIRGLSSKRFPLAAAAHYLELTKEGFRDVARATPVFDAAKASLQKGVARGAGGEDLIVARDTYLTDPL